MQAIPAVREIVRRALSEDIGRGDITTRCLVPARASATGVVYLKEPGVIAALDVAEMVFRELDPGCRFESLVEEGPPVPPGAEIARVSGPAWAVLSGERVALNFLQRLSGIATRTYELARLAARHGVRVADTRKTTPGLRVLEKYAVRVGGGVNHRLGLDDAVLIKDNHIVVAGGVAKAVELARGRIPMTAKIEVEAKTEEEVVEALRAGADIVMLDNMDCATMARMVELIRIHDGADRSAPESADKQTPVDRPRRTLVEASGRVDVSNVEQVARTGVDVISAGAITHSARALDMSLEITSMGGS